MLVFGTPFVLALWWGRSAGSGETAWNDYLRRCAFLAALGAFCSALLLDGSALPLLLAIPAWLVTIYPARRRVFKETWSLWRYLTFELRVIAGLQSPWFALAFMPALVRALPAQPVAAAPIGALVLIGCLISLDNLQRRLLGAKPLDSALDATFASVLERARCPRPTLLRLVPAGGQCAVALALPHSRSPRVVFGQTLIDQLTQAELTAILGHELAHLEHYDRARLRGWTRVFYTLLALSAAIVPLTAAIGPKYMSVIVTFWPCIVTSCLGFWSASKQTHEQESDLRGIELAGDPEAMISALTKVHRLNNIPRRFHPDIERSLSHPSLARRIHRIRAAHPTSAPTGEPPTETLIVEVANDPRCQLIFEREQLLIAIGVPEKVAREPVALTAAAANLRAIAYRDVSSAQVISSWRGPRLHARTREGELLEFKLRVAEVPRVEQALDRIAEMFTVPPAAPSKVRNVWRVLLLAFIAVSPLPRELPIAITLGAALLVVAPTSGVLRAMTALCVSTFALLLAWSTPWAALDPRRSTMLALLAAAALICAWRSAAAVSDGQRTRSLAVATLSVGCALLLGLGLLAERAEFFHDALQRIPSLPLALIALAAGLWVGASRRLRALASLALAIGIASLIAGSAAFYASITAEPFLASARSLQPRRVVPRVTHEIEINQRVTGEVAISPSGAWVTFGHPTQRSEPISRYTFVGRDGARRSFDTGSVVAVDDTRALLLEGDRLRVVTWTEDRPESEIRLEGVSAESEFGFEPASGRYWVRSEDEQGAVEELGGMLGAQPDVRRSLRLPDGVYPTSIPPSALQLGMSVTATMPSQSLLLLEKLRLLRRPRRYSTQLWAISQQRSSRLLQVREFAQCQTYGRDGRLHVCLTAAARSYAWQLDLESGRVRPLGVFPADVYAPSLLANTLAVSARNAVFTLDVNSGEAREYPLEPKAGCGAAAELLPRHIAVIQRCRQHTRIQFWAR